MNIAFRRTAAAVALVLGALASTLAHADLFRQMLVEGSTVLNVTRDTATGLDWTGWTSG